MKRIAAMILLLVILSGCAAEKPQEIAEDIRNNILNAEQITMTADIVADYGSRAYQFRLRLVSKDEGWLIEVIEPENISGLTASVSADSSSLEYDGVILDTGYLNSMGLSPMNCLPTIINAWINGHVDEAIRYEDEGAALVSISYTVSDDTDVSTVFEEEKLLPQEAFISVDGYTVISCHFGNVVIE